MTTEFIKETERLISQLKEEGLPIESYSILPDGCSDPALETQIRSINQSFRHTDSDRLSGNWLLIYVVPETAAARINLDDAERTVEKEGLPALKAFLKQAVQNAAKSCGEIEKLNVTDLNTLRDKLVVRLLPLKLIQTDSTGPVYRPFCDMALTVYIELFRQDDAYFSAKLLHCHCDGWNMSDDEIVDAALANMMKKYPPRLIDMSHTDPESMLDCRKEFMHQDFGRHFSHLCLMTTDDLNGGTALFYPGIADRIYELAEEEYYAVMTSPYEVQLHTASHFTPEKLYDLLERNNKMFSDSRLTDTVLRYDPAKKILCALPKPSAADTEL